MYYLNYINEKLRQNPNLPNRKEILDRIENFNSYVGGSETMIKRLL
jgi:hypothetical protein